MGPLGDSAQDEMTSGNYFLSFGLIMICFNDIAGWKLFSPDPLNISYGGRGGWFLFQGCVIALGVDGSILRNIKFLSSTMVPTYVIRPTTRYRSNWACKRSLGKMSWLIV